MTAEELDLVETDDLIAALRRRSSASVIGLLDDRTDTEESRITYWSGGPMTAIGLADYVREKILRELIDPSLRKDWGAPE